MSLLNNSHFHNLQSAWNILTVEQDDEFQKKKKDHLIKSMNVFHVFWNTLLVLMNIKTNILICLSEVILRKHGQTQFVHPELLTDWTTNQETCVALNNVYYFCQTPSIFMHIRAHFLSKFWCKKLNKACQTFTSDTAG